MTRIAPKIVPTQPTLTQSPLASTEVSHVQSGIAGGMRRGTIKPEGIPVEISYQVMPRAQKAGYLYQISLKGEGKAVVSSRYILESSTHDLGRQGAVHAAVGTCLVDVPVTAYVWFRNGNDDVFKLGIQFDPNGYPELKEAVRGDGHDMV